MITTSIKSRAGIEYIQGNYNNDWYIRHKWDKPNTFVGAEHYLPNEILKKLSRIRKLNDWTLMLIRNNRKLYRTLAGIK